MLKTTWFVKSKLRRANKECSVGRKVTKLVSTMLSSLAFALIPMVAEAIGLGNIVLHSHLNEPLDAEIALKDLKGVEPGDVIATVADQQAYEVAGLQPIGWLTSIRFQVVKDDVAGRPVLKLKTKEAVKDPFVDLLIEVKWPAGRLLREYTLLLDPPKSVIPSSKMIQKKQKIIPVIGAQAEKKTRKEVSSAVCQPSSTRQVQTIPGGTYGPIGDESLWSIAKSLSLNTHSNVHQAVMAIAEKNPHAFRDGNINYMLSGAVLKLPDKAELESYTLEQSQYYIAMQGQTPYHEPHSASPAHTVATATAVKSAAPKPQKALKLVAPVQSLSSAAKVNADAPNKTENQVVLAERLTLIEEAIDTLKRNNEDMTRKNQTLQSQNQSLEKLLSMKEDEIKKLVDMVKQPNATQTTAEVAQGQFAVAVSDLPQKRTELGLNEPTLAQMMPPKPVESSQVVAPVNNPPLPVQQAMPENPVPNLAENQLKPNTIKVDNIASHSQPQSKVITADEIPASVPVPLKALVGDEAEKPAGNSLFLFLIFSFCATLMTLAWLRRNALMIFVEPYLQRFAKPNSDTVAVGQDQEVLNYGMQFDLDRAIDAISAQEKKFKKTGQSAKKVKETFESEGGFDSKFADVEECISYERFGQAEKILKEILQQKPDEWVAVFKLLELYVLTEKYNEFIRLYEGLPQDLKEISPRVWSKIETLRQKVMNESVRLHSDEREPTPNTPKVKVPLQSAVKEKRPLALEPISSEKEQSLNMPEVEESYDLQSTPSVTESDSDNINIEVLPTSEENTQDLQAQNNTQDIQKAQIALAKAYIDMGEFADAKELLNDLKKEASGEHLAQIQALIDSIS